MKASYYTQWGERSVIQYGDLPTPQITSPSGILIRIKASALNHLDIWVRKGLPFLKLPLPHIPGGDGAGLVEKVGSGVENFKSGDKVLIHPGLSCGVCTHCRSGWESLCKNYAILGEHCWGTYAEYVVVPHQNVFPLPENLSYEEGACIALAFTTAWQMVVHRAQVKPGETVLVHAAASGVSTALIQIAKVFGARVIATASTEKKLALARDLGADVTFLFSEQDFKQQIKKNCPEGIDVILDHSGKITWEENLRVLKSGGRVVLCGATSGFEAITDLRHVFYRQLSLLGSTMGSKRDFPKILDLFKKGVIKPVLGAKFKLSEISLAQEQMENRNQLGKTVLVP
jgi:NADPH:quinone reductase-like Zn-dependent oxidoreductase